MATDGMLTMLEDVLTQRPPVCLALESLAEMDKWREEWATWLDQIGQVIHALPTQSQRWDATVRAADSMAVPGMPLNMAYLRVLEAVLKAGGEL